MKKNLSIPYNGDTKSLYETIIPKYKDSIKEVYFPLPAELATNARTSGTTVALADSLVLMEVLRSDNINGALIINSSWMPLEAYTDDYISKLFSGINALYKRGLRKIILKNNYYMNTGLFKKVFPELHVEASINQMLDTYDKVVQAVELFGYDSVIVDRSLNRNFAEFIKVTDFLQRRNIGAKLLLNEGCLYACPFKQDHDNMIGMCSYSGKLFSKYKYAFLEEYPDKDGIIRDVNVQYGCVNVYENNPWMFLKSPFIRPEDLGNYEDHVDLVKISGRTQSTEWIIRAIDGYVNKSYDGNIRDLTDTGPIGNLSYPNKKLDKLFKMTSKCNKDCSSCGYCKNLYLDNFGGN